MLLMETDSFYAFVEERCEYVPGAVLPLSGLLAEYDAYCQEEGYPAARADASRRKRLSAALVKKFGDPVKRYARNGTVFAVRVRNE